MRSAWEKSAAQVQHKPHLYQVFPCKGPQLSKVSQGPGPKSLPVR